MYEVFKHTFYAPKPSSCPPKPLQVYPTSVRSLGVGATNAFSRLGALVSPFISVMLVRNHHQAAAVSLLGGACLVAAACALLLPVETKGRALQVS